MILRVDAPKGPQPSASDRAAPAGHSDRSRPLRGGARRGFTLIELLVAMALTLFTMMILTQAFVAGLDTFRGLKAIGDMQARLRTASAILRSDLSADHFEGRRRLSDNNLWSNPPQEGFFMVRQNSASTLEGTDAEVLPSYRSVDQAMAFTIKLRGNRQENYMTSQDIPTFPPATPAAQKWSPLSLPTTNFFGQDRDVLFNPGGPPNWPTTGNSPPPGFPPGFNPQGSVYPTPDTFASQWAEVSYYLLQTGSTDDINNPGGGGFPLFGLYRSQHLLVPNTETANKLDSNKPAGDPTLGTTPNVALTANYYYSGISCYPRPNPINQLYFNSPADLALRASTANAGGTTFRTAGMDQRVMAALANPAIGLPLPAASFPPGTPAGRPPRGSTLVVPNLVSFNVQVLYAGATDFIDVVPLQNLGLNAPVIRLYDTTLLSASGTPIPSAVANIVGLKITMRVWDDKTGFSRQLTLIQDM